MVKWISFFYFGLFVCTSIVAASKETLPQIDFLQEAQNENFSPDELNFLQPLIEHFQLQYDYILSKPIESHTDNENSKHLEDLIFNVLENFPLNDHTLNEPFTFNTQLPLAQDLNGLFQGKMSAEEALDLENILREDIEDAERTIQDLVAQSNEITANLLSINKIKILKFIYKMLGSIFTIAVRVARTAYCTYSHLPEINSTLTDGRNNIGWCYRYTTTSITNLRTEVQGSIDTIRKNVVELVNIYKKITNNQSLLGKLFSLLLNVSKIRNDISDSQSTAYNTINVLKSQVPTVVSTTQECATTSIPTFVTQLNETITSLVTCLNFVDDSTVGPEPEPESSEESSEELDVNDSHKLF